TGVLERRHPGAVAQLRVPADMIVVKVRAHHVVDVLGSRPGGSKPFEIRRVEHVPERTCRPALVVAAAAIDQDVHLPDLEEPAVYAELDETLVWIVMIRRHP